MTALYLLVCGGASRLHVLEERNATFNIRLSLRIQLLLGKSYSGQALSHDGGSSNGVKTLAPLTTQH